MKKSVVSKGGVLSSWWYFVLPAFLILGIIFVILIVPDIFEKAVVPGEEAAVGEEAVIVEEEIVSGEEGAVAEEAEVSTGKTGVTSGSGGSGGGSSGGGGASSSGDTSGTEEEAVTVAVTEEIVSLTIPYSLENNCIGFLVGGPSNIETIPLVGAAWGRPHPGPFSWGFIESTPGEYNFSAPDKWVKKAQENNVLLIATFFPYASWDQGEDSACKVSEDDMFYSKIPISRCKPKDTEAYKNFLTILIERYDGDGVDDMPGLEIPVKYWEISNEPDLNSSTLTFFVGDEQDYVDLLKESYPTIKQACPDCMVLHGGAAGSQEIFLSFWDTVFALGGGDYFDIANIHSIRDREGSDFNVGAFRSLLEKYNLDKPIWVPSVQFLSPDDDVLTSTQKAFDAGAEKVLFSNFIVGVRGPSGGQYSEVYRDVVALCPHAEEVAAAEAAVCTDILPTCADGEDNDDDGTIDLEDSDCVNWEAREVSTHEEVVVCAEALPSCADGKDNDGDGNVDLEDADCVNWGSREFTD